MRYPLPKRLKPSSERWYRAWKGPTEPDRPRRLHCFLYGCNVPKRIDENHPAVTPRGGGYSYLRAIDCPRCGRIIQPYDRDYPTIEP